MLRASMCALADLASSRPASERRQDGDVREGVRRRGEPFELYASDDEAGFQLVDGESLPVGAAFADVPDWETVAALVRVSHETGEAA